MTSLVFQIVILFVKILAELLVIILVPAFALKFFKKDLSFGLAFSASILMILLPVLTYVNNAELNNTMLPFASWGVGSVLTLSWMSWGLSTGAIISFLYAAYLIVESRAPRDDKFSPALHGSRLPLKSGVSGSCAVSAVRIFRSKSCQRRPTVLMPVAGTCLRRGYLRKVF